MTRLFDKIVDLLPSLSDTEREQLAEHCWRDDEPGPTDDVTVAEMIHQTMADLLKRGDDPPPDSLASFGTENLDPWMPDSGLVVVGGRPSCGKSAVLRSAIVGTLQKGGDVLVCSLETPEFVVERQIGEAVFGIQLRGRDNFTAEDLAVMKAAHEDMKRRGGRVSVWCPPTITARGFCRWVHTMAERNGAPALVVLDYVNLLKPPGRQSRYEDVASDSNRLKWLSRSLGVPVLVAAQCNRNPLGREDRRPLAHDLRDSGTIEEDADLLLLLHRPRYYDGKAPEGIEVHVAKDRSRERHVAWLKERGWESMPDLPPDYRDTRFRLTFDVSTGRVGSHLEPMQPTPWDARTEP